MSTSPQFNYVLSYDWISSLPTPSNPNFLASNIAGSPSNKTKQLAANLLYETIGSTSVNYSLYSKSVGERAKIVRMEIDTINDVHGPFDCSADWEFVIQPEDCNSYGILHGGCSAYLADACGAAPLALLGAALRRPIWGPTLELNAKYLGPARMGATILIQTKMVGLVPGKTNQFILHVVILDKTTGARILEATQKRFVPKEALAIPAKL
ncbi:hypothetical protein DL96DRAFT_1600060 [Flagelloscypha sp. PMI_526]|nr:hypothetical protein DL96DRAFT_1600060 [Flagelloscypha sp. PMI_526]